MNIILALVIGYILGSIPFALVIGKVFYKTDVRKFGSGNLGGSNAGRVLGKKVGVAVTIMDAIKCIIAMGIMMLIDPSCVLYAGFGAAIGHCYPMFANFKGGKAVATIMGYVLGLVLFSLVPWYVFFLPLASFFAILKVCKFVSFSSICMIFIAFVLTLLSSSTTTALSIFVLWCFCTYRHRSNIGRLLKGTETKITWM